MKRHYLGEFEELVLLTVAMTSGEAYGFSVAQQIRDQTQRVVRLNQVHGCLQRLEDKGLLTSAMSEPLEQRGGRSKRLFSITAYGTSTLRDIKDTRNNLWNLIPDQIQSTK